MERGLIDEMTLNVVPITLGNGYSLFARNSSELAWTFGHCNRYDNGVVQTRYTANGISLQNPPQFTRHKG